MKLSETLGSTAAEAMEQMAKSSDEYAKGFENMKAVLAAAGAKPEHLARVTIYVTDKTAYRESTRAIGDAWRRILGAVFPAMSLVQVADLLEDGALVEIEGTAVLP